MRLLLFLLLIIPTLVFAQESTTTIMELSGLEKASESMNDLLAKIIEVIDPLIVGSLGTVLGLVLVGKRALKLLKIIKPLAHILITSGKILDLCGQTLLKIVAKVEE